MLGVQASNDLVEIDKRNMGEPNRIEGLMDVVERDLEVSNRMLSFEKVVSTAQFRKTRGKQKRWILQAGYSFFRRTGGFWTNISRTAPGFSHSCADPYPAHLL